MLGKGGISVRLHVRTHRCERLVVWFGVDVTGEVS